MIVTTESIIEYYEQNGYYQQERGRWLLTDGTEIGPDFEDHRFMGSTNDDEYGLYEAIADGHITMHYGSYFQNRGLSLSVRCNPNRTTYVQESMLQRLFEIADEVFVDVYDDSGDFVEKLDSGDFFDDNMVIWMKLFDEIAYNEYMSYLEDEESDEDDMFSFLDEDDEDE